MRAHIVDAFADAQFAGNPAAVVPLPRFPLAETMQALAHQIDVPTIAFLASIVRAPSGMGGVRPCRKS